MENNMWWEPREALHIFDCIIRPEMKDIREMMNEERWDSGKLQQALPERIINHFGESVPSPEPYNTFLTDEIEREVWTYFTNDVALHEEISFLHGDLYPVEKIIHGINENIHKFTGFKFPFFLNLPMNRPSIAEVLESWEQRCRLKIVSWIHPLDGWYKCNVDDASNGNPDRNSVAFCVRNCFGDIIVVKGRRHPVSTNLFAKSVAIKEGI
ncbi:hypothetical protein H5410_026821 [Solanum commersonii]|uniref:Uncharacterized protein n=1 Tax=Solanum commersonii TaxID=4109 RepID=A0A9J5YXL2_SOLCO|nr:hypothetical protein H5410_026821 [Solanum commersonii]